MIGVFLDPRYNTAADLPDLPDHGEATLEQLSEIYRQFCGATNLPNVDAAENALREGIGNHLYAWLSAFLETWDEAEARAHKPIHDEFRRQVVAKSQDNPEEWWEGWDAAQRGESVLACPYTPLDEPLMIAWCSGHVTGMEERASA